MKSLEDMGLHGVVDETILGVYNTVATIKEKCSGIGMIDEGWKGRNRPRRTSRSV